MKKIMAVVWTWVRQKEKHSRKLNSQFMTLSYGLSLPKVFHQKKAF